MMHIYGLNVWEATLVVANVSHEWWADNVIIRDSRDMSNTRGGRARVTLRVLDGRDGMPGARGSASSVYYGSGNGTGPHGLRRLTNATCWHAHRDVLRAWFRHGATRVHTAVANYRAETFESQFPPTAWENIGSQMYPVHWPELCNCVHGTGNGPDNAPLEGESPFQAVAALTDVEQIDSFRSYPQVDHSPRYLSNDAATGMTIDELIGKIDKELGDITTTKESKS